MKGTSVLLKEHTQLILRKAKCTIKQLFFLGHLSDLVSKLLRLMHFNELSSHSAWL